MIFHIAFNKYQRQNIKSNGILKGSRAQKILVISSGEGRRGRLR